MPRHRPPTTEPAGIEIRPATNDDIHDVARLWCEAFPGRRTVEERTRMLEEGGRYGGLETVVVARDTTGLAGALKIYRMEQHLAGTTLPMMGLAAVAVERSRRRRGLGARLCTEAVRRAADRGDVVSVLYPFRPDYYERLGWGLVGGLLEYRFETGALPAYAEATRVRPATVADRDGIVRCYARVAARSNGPITRDATIWDYRLADADLGVQPAATVEPDPARAPEAGAAETPRAVVYEDEKIVGYALLRYARPRARGDRRIDVRELVADTEPAYRGLLGYLAKVREAWPIGRHYARYEERFGDRLRDPRPPGHRRMRSLYFPTARVARGPMLRVLNAPAALRQRRWPADSVGRAFRVRIDDDQLPGNAGPWWVEPRAAGAAVGREAGAGSPDAELRTDAASFARIFAGELPPTDAARIGSARLGGDAALLDRAFATRERFWLLDEF